MMFITQTRIVCKIKTNIGIKWKKLDYLEKDYCKEKTITNPEVSSIVSS